MIEKQIKDSFNHAKLNQDDKNRILQNIMQETSSSTDVIEIKSKIGRRYTMKKIAAACVAIGLAGSLSVGAYAGYKWLSPSKVVMEAGEDKKLAEAFGKSASEIQIQENGEYRVANLGMVSGKDMGREFTADGKVVSDRTYIVVAVERKDKVPMTQGDGNLFVCPLVQGIRPWQYYRYADNRAATYFVKDGVLYYLAEGDNIEKFAANKVYLAVQDGITYSTDAYNYDEQTGEITRKSEYKGINILFDLQLDKSKADEKAAQEIIDQAKRENAADDEESEKTATESKDEKDEKPSIIQSSVTDKQNNLKLNILDSSYFRGIGSDDEVMKGEYAFYPEIIGEGIDTITYSLDKGIFIEKKEVTEKEFNDPSNATESSIGGGSKEYLGGELFGDPKKPYWVEKEGGSSYTVKYEEQNKADHVYGIQIEVKGKKIGFDCDDNGFRNYTLIAEEFSKRNITATIKYKDGHTVTKNIVFKKGTGKIPAHKGKLEWQ